MNKGRHSFAILLLICLTGCAPAAFLVGAAAGVGGYKYYEGALTVIYQAAYENTWNASIKALEQMGIKVKDKERQLTTGKIEASLADDKPVRITVKYKSSSETEVTIRVGLLGDENASNVIKDKIAEVLFR
jgi:uncharacterized lipoprotein